jgi:hypothetical protein
MLLLQLSCPSILSASTYPEDAETLNLCISLRFLLLGVDSNHGAGINFVPRERSVQQHPASMVAGQTAAAKQNCHASSLQARKTQTIKAHLERLEAALQSPNHFVSVFFGLHKCPAILHILHSMQPRRAHELSHATLALKLHTHHSYIIQTSLLLLGDLLPFLPLRHFP